MKKPVVRRCPDGHFCRIIYDLGPFIADYPEQVMLTGLFKAGVPGARNLHSEMFY